MSPTKQIAVLMTTHNREECLERALESLRVSAGIAEVVVKVFVANSGSPPTTKFPQDPDSKFSVIDIEAPETSFWASSMRLAWQGYMESKFKSDFVLWLNEDTYLDGSGLETLLRVADEGRGEIIVVGSTRSKNRGYSYGGKNRVNGLLRLHFVDVMPHDNSVRECLTFNGNCVLIPSKVDASLGGFPDGYTHLRADLAYGLLAAKKKFRTFIAPGFVAECEANGAYPQYRELALVKLSMRLRFLSNPKVGPLPEHIKFCLRFGGIAGFFYAVAPVVRSLLAR
jgi:GT2 family glycosyltransferase